MAKIETLNKKLKAKGKKGQGMIEIPYASLDELDRLLKMLLADGA